MKVPGVSMAVILRLASNGKVDQMEKEWMAAKRRVQLMQVLVKTLGAGRKAL